MPNVPIVKDRGEAFDNAGMHTVPANLREHSLKIAKAAQSKIAQIVDLDLGSGASTLGMNMFGAFASDTFLRMQRRIAEVIHFMEQGWSQDPLDNAAKEVVAVLEKLELNEDDRARVTTLIRRHYG